MDTFKALLVDDEEDLVSTLVERLGFRGIEAEYALDGYAALAKIDAKKFDVIILDLKLPGMDGIEVSRKIREIDSEVPILLITGHGAPLEDVSDDEDMATIDYLVKPISLDALIEKMREAVNKR